MSWRDQLRPGSWRGAAFMVKDHTAEGGRRGELHEFPEREQPWFEDLGGKAKRWSIEAVVVGKGYMAERDALLAACGVAGAGTLVHPFLGMLSVVCETYSLRETTEEGGAAFFSFEFSEAGAILPAEAGADTGDLVAAAADEARAAAPAEFAAEFSVIRWPAWVEGGAVDLVHQLTGAAVTAGLLLGGSGSVLRAFEVGLSILPAGALSLVRAPLALGQAVSGLIGAVAGLGGVHGRRIAALRGIAAAAHAAPTVIGDTPARTAQRANQTAFQKLVTVLVAAELVDEAASIEFASYDEAVTLREQLADELDVAAIALADAGDDAGAATLDRLRLVMVRDITARGGSLARLYDYRPARTEPALVIAHRLYGDPETVVAQAEDIVARNHVAHPLFVAGGSPLEVRTNV